MNRAVLIVLLSIATALLAMLVFVLVTAPPTKLSITATKSVRMR